MKDSESKPWLKLMYITNKPEVAQIAETCGVDRVWIDLETLGKEDRQPGNTVKSHHSIENIKDIKPLLTKSEMLVRVEPWNEGSREEIEKVIEAGADVIMLPMWKSVEEVDNFLRIVNKRAKTTLLLETKEAVECVDEVLSLKPDEVHIGLNDLHLSYGLDFMFELLPRGDVQVLCEKFQRAGIPYGFGGIARLGRGTLKSEKIIMEHKRLGSTRAILSRSFCDASACADIFEFETLFAESMKELLAYEEYCTKCSEYSFRKNQAEIADMVDKIAVSLKEKKRYGA